LVVNVLLYRVLWGLGLTPWERVQAWADQVSAMFDREEQGRQRPYGAALDLGSGTGIWSVDLAERGWDVTGVEIVPKALHAARERAHKTGVEVRFLEGSVAVLRDAGAGSGFRLVLDFGTVHGLAPSEVKAVAREVSAVTTDDATVLMYAFSPGRKGPTPRGLSREEVEAAYAGWTVVDEQPFDTSGMPALFKKAHPRWYRLRRVES
jgi:SAM-dependent methyltransferase